MGYYSKNKKQLNLFLVLFIVICYLLSEPVFAYVMESNNYRIQSDSLNIGGARQTSTNYIMRDTIGEVATGMSTTTNFKLKAGYQQMQEVYLSVSSPITVTMTNDIPGITGNPGAPASGDAVWTVKTDNAAGFNMKINVTHDPALYLDATYEFSDYSVADEGTPDYNWDAPGSGVAEFGFTVEASTDADTVQLFLDDGAVCDAGSTAGSDTCWFDFKGTTDIDIINRTTRTDSAGENEKVKFWAESNAKYLKQGTYTATITVTVAAN